MSPSGWEKQAIGKLCQSIVPGRNKPKSFDGHIPWVTTPEIRGRYIPSKVQRNYVSVAAIKESGAKIVPVGSVIIAAVGELGLTAIAKEQVVLNQQLHAFVCPDFINNEYLAYWLETQKSYMESVASKTTIPYMNKANCESIPVAYPPLPEQQKIAQILSTWDKAMEKLEALIAAKQKRKKALMQQLLTGKKRFSGFDESWMEVSMDDIFKRVTRKNTEDNTNVVTISAQKGLIKQGEFFNKSIASEILDNYFLLKNGEFAYNKSYSNGYPMGAVKKLNNYEKAVVTTLYICFAIKDKSISCSNFFEQYFESGRLVHGLMKVANEGGRAHGLLNVTPKDFFGLKLFIPQLTEQQKIASALSTADQEIQTHQNQLSALKQQKKGLMQQLLTGKKRVKTEV